MLLNWKGGLMFESILSTTSTTNLDEVLTRIAAHDAVKGIVIMGSVVTDKVHSYSDYDILLVLDKAAPPLFLALTNVDGHLAEFYCIQEQLVDRLLANEELQVEDGSIEAFYVRSISDGRIVTDQTEKLVRLRALVEAGNWFKPQMWSDSGVYNEWFRANYNIQQMRRYLASPDSTYQMTVDFRLLYSAMDAFTAYQRVRKLPWRGEKEMIRYLTVHDPAFLEIFRQFFAETDRVHKVQLYEKLAEMALAPVGQVWGKATTAIQTEPEMVRTALDFWQELVATK